MSSCVPSAPTSRDLREGMDVEGLEGPGPEVRCVQLPSPRKVRIEERDFG